MREHRHERKSATADDGAYADARTGSERANSRRRCHLQFFKHHDVDEKVSFQCHQADHLGVSGLANEMTVTPTRWINVRMVHAAGSAGT